MFQFTESFKRIEDVTQINLWIMKSEALDVNRMIRIVCSPVKMQFYLTACIWPTSLPVSSWAWQGCDPGICCITAQYSHMVHHCTALYTHLQSLTHSHREDFFSVKHNHFEPTHCTRGVPGVVKQNNLCGCMLNICWKSAFPCKIQRCQRTCFIMNL